MNDRIHYIYGLFDPNDGAVRYIGRTVNTKVRLTNHIVGGTNDVKTAWIRGLKQQGQRPELVVLQTCDSLEEAKAAEHEWIKKVNDQGGDLTNGTYPGFTRARKGRRNRH